MDIAQKTVAAIRWSSGTLILRQALQLCTTVLLARLLQPADFGLVGMAAVVSGFAGQFHSMGTSAAVIQKKELSDELLSSVFWANLGFGLAITLVLLLVAPLVALFYGEPRLADVVRALSFSFCLYSPGMVQQAILERELSFETLGRVEIVATAVSACVAVGCAWVGAGVWSLVMQSLSLALVASALLWSKSNWRPSLTFNWQEVRAIAPFSMNLTGFNICNYLVRNADNLLIGRFLGASSLGLYSLAYNIMLYPLQSISSCVGRVLFPAFSRYQEDSKALRGSYLKVCGAISAITFPLMLGLVAVNEPLVLGVFGAQWEGLILLLYILAPLGMLQSVAATVGTVYQAMGRTDLLLRWGVGTGIVILGAIAFGLQWGVVGVAAAYATACLLLAYANFAIPFRLISLPVRQLVKVVSPPLLCGSTMLLAVAGADLLMGGGLSHLGRLFVLVPLGVLVYLLASWKLNRVAIADLKSFVGMRP